MLIFSYDKTLKLLIGFILLLLFSNNSYAHPGRLDKSGCHTDYKNNSYHCHNQKKDLPKSSTIYDRDSYKHWSDFDKDCQDTRDEVLILHNIGDLKLSEDSCDVISGLWFDPYSGKEFTNPSDLDIDHIVPLSEADKSGSHNWKEDKKEEFANDFENLLPVYSSLNRSKGGKDPNEWMPPNKDYSCKYINSWMYIKNKWQLSYDNEEVSFLNNFRKECYK